MKCKPKFLFGLFLICFYSLPAQYWWQQNNLRVMQVNLPAYEASTIDPDSLISDLRKFSANTLIINAGGIMAFYPTRLPYHYINPYMKEKMLEQVIKKCHEQKIKVITRFDFSRIDKSIFDLHPDWAYMDSNGDRMINSDKYVTCINGPYVQEKAFEIIAEVLDHYPVDGIFLNMPGYQTNNSYIGKYHGIDQNDHDRKRFYDWSSGLPLPKKEDNTDPVFRKYVEFKKYTTTAWQKKLYDLVKSKNKNIAICTYAAEYVDIIRHESQTNSLPYFIYNASDNVSTILSSYPHHMVSNASIQQISFRSRYNAVEPEETEIRLWENIANGSGLDMSMMGDFRNYEDERSFEVWRKIYAHHKKFEKYYGRYRSIAKVALIAPGWWTRNQEFRGIFQMLKEAHIPFDVIEDSQIGALDSSLLKYDLFIFPDVIEVDKATLQTIQLLKNKGKKIIATNKSFSGHPDILSNVFGVKHKKSIDECDGHYLSITDHKIFSTLKGQSMIHLKFNMAEYDMSDTDEKIAPILSSGIPGPPEMIGGHEPLGSYGIGIKRCGQAVFAFVPLNLGRHYFIYGYENHKNIILDLINYLSESSSDQVITNSHPRVEIIVQEFMYNTDKTFTQPFKRNGLILHAINLTGFSGNTYFKPIPVKTNTFSVKTDFKPNSVKTMKENKLIPFKYRAGMVQFNVNEIKEYEAILIE